MHEYTVNFHFPIIHIALFDAQLSASLQVSVEFSGATQEVHTSLTFQVRQSTSDKGKYIV